jgi:hypothetical protein
MTSKTKELNLKTAAEYLGLKSTQHVRDLAKAGKIPGAHKVTIEDTNIKTWRFTTAGLDAFKAEPRKGGGGSRDGKQYIVIVPTGREQEFADAMAGLGMEQYRRPVTKTLTKKQRAAKQAAVLTPALPPAEDEDTEDEAE